MKKKDVSIALMTATHYPGSSVPTMGEAVRSKMPRQKTKRSFAGARPDYVKNYD